MIANPVGGMSFLCEWSIAPKPRIWLISRAWYHGWLWTTALQLTVSSGYTWLVKLLAWFAYNYSIPLSFFPEIQQWAVSVTDFTNFYNSVILYNAAEDYAPTHLIELLQLAISDQHNHDHYTWKYQHRNQWDPNEKPNATQYTSSNILILS